MNAAGGLATPTYVPKEFMIRIFAFNLIFPLQQREIGCLTRARRPGFENSGEVVVSHELHERLGVLFLRQSDLVNYHVVTPITYSGLRDLTL
jgi:hypothetical protein